MSMRIDASYGSHSATLVMELDRIHRWRAILEVAGWSALASLVLTLTQVLLYVRWPPPESAQEAYALFADNPLLGLLSLDVLYIVNNLLVLLLYLGLFVVLWRSHRAIASIAILLGSVGMAVYMSSNVSFEMLALADGFQTADPAGQVALIAVGEGMLAVFRGTAFDVYYVLSCIALILFATAMLRSGRFGRATGVSGLIAGILMIIPSTAGTPGMIFALASLVPWVVFAGLVGAALLRMSRDEMRHEEIADIG